MVQSSTVDWYWVNSGNHINYDIEFKVGEPNNYTGNEWCLSMAYRLGTFAFNDYDCTRNMFNFICQTKDTVYHDP